MATTFRQGNTDPRVVVEDETGIVLCETCPTAEATGEQNAARIAAALNAHGPMKGALEAAAKALAWAEGSEADGPSMQDARREVAAALALAQKVGTP